MGQIKKNSYMGLNIRAYYYIDGTTSALHLKQLSHFFCEMSQLRTRHLLGDIQYKYEYSNQWSWQKDSRSRKDTSTSPANKPRVKMSSWMNPLTFHRVPSPACKTANLTILIYSIDTEKSFIFHKCQYPYTICLYDNTLWWKHTLSFRSVSNSLRV